MNGSTTDKIKSRRKTQTPTTQMNNGKKRTVDYLQIPASIAVHNNCCADNDLETK